MRKCSSLLTGLLFMFISFNCVGQELQNYWGIKAGIAIPNLTARGSGDNPLSSGYSSRLGPDAALFWEHAISNTFSVVPGIEYSSEGGKKSGFQPFPFPQDYAALYAQLFPSAPIPSYLYANFSNEIKLDYVMINVLAKFNRHLGEASPFMLYGEIGPFGAYLVSAKDVTSGSSLVYADAQMQQQLITTPVSFDNKMDVSSEVHKGNFGLTADIGLAFNFSNSRIFIEAGGNYGLLNIQKDAANGKNGIGAVNGRVGYAFSLGSRY